jgi:hypothetical protein
MTAEEIVKLGNIQTGVTEWSRVAPSSREGKTGTATARTRQLGDVQLRLVEYSAGYVADHWCHKGHIVYVISGDLIIEHEDGTRYTVKSGVSYHVGDDQKSPHRALSEVGATLFILD